MNKKILIIQTAFIGDVILATSLLDYITKEFPQAQIDFLLRKGNESLLADDKRIKKLHIWDKKNGKIRNLLRLIKSVRNEKYDTVLNIQRFFSSGLLTAFSGAKERVGFDKNPMSLFFTHKVKHLIPDLVNGKPLHEVQRNFKLLNEIFPTLEIPNEKSIPPVLKISREEDFKVEKYNDQEYIVLAPASVWFTKQWNQENWKSLTTRLSTKYKILFIGAPTDIEFCNSIIGTNDNCENLCGKLSLRESAALMRNARRVFVNDSAPLHLASSVNAKTTAIFCSTVPEFGYGPLAQNSSLIQLSPRLDCMPCGLHGKSSCPHGHFKCAKDISIETLIDSI